MMRTIIVLGLLFGLMMPAQAGVADDFLGVLSGASAGAYLIEGSDATGAGPGLSYDLGKKTLRLGEAEFDAILGLDVMLAVREGTNSLRGAYGVSANIGQVGKPVFTLGLGYAGSEYGSVRLTVDGKQLFRLEGVAPYVALTWRR